MQVFIAEYEATVRCEAIFNPRPLHPETPFALASMVRGIRYYL